MNKRTNNIRADQLTNGFLLMLNPDKLAVITLHVVVGQLMKGEESFSPDTPQAGMCKFVRVVERLGEAVQAEVNLAFDQLIFAISDETYTYYKDMAASYNLPVSYKSRVEAAKKAQVATKR